MAATTSGTKTVTHALAPHLSATLLTTLMATPLENFTIAQLNEISDALKRVADGENPLRTIGSLIT
jgi:hypothetical protein